MTLTVKEALHLAKERGIITEHPQPERKKALTVEQATHLAKERGLLPVQEKSTSLKHKAGVAGRSLISNLLGAFPDLALSGINLQKMNPHGKVTTYDPEGPSNLSSNKPISVTEMVKKGIDKATHDRISPKSGGEKLLDAVIGAVGPSVIGKVKALKHAPSLIRKSFQALTPKHKSTIAAMGTGAAYQQNEANEGREGMAPLLESLGISALTQKGLRGVGAPFRYYGKKVREYTPQRSDIKPHINALFEKNIVGNSPKDLREHLENIDRIVLGSAKKNRSNTTQSTEKFKEQIVGNSPKDLEKSLEELDEIVLASGKKSAKNAQKYYKTSELENVNEALHPEYNSPDRMVVIGDTLDPILKTFRKIESPNAKENFFSGSAGKILEHIVPGISKYKNLNTKLLQDIIKTQEIPYYELEAIRNSIKNIYKNTLSPDSNNKLLRQTERNIKFTQKNKIGEINEKALQDLEKADEIWEYHKNKEVPIVESISRESHKLGKPFEASLTDIKEGGSYPKITLKHIESPESRQAYVKNIYSQLGNENGIFNVDKFLNEYNQLKPYLKKELNKVSPISSKLLKELETFKGIDTEHRKLVEGISRESHKLGKPFEASLTDIKEGGSYPEFTLKHIESPESRQAYVKNIYKSLGDKEGKFEAPKFSKEYESIKPYLKEALENISPISNRTKKGLTKFQNISEKNSDLSDIVADLVSKKLLKGSAHLLKKAALHPASLLRYRPTPKNIESLFKGLHESKPSRSKTDILKSLLTETSKSLSPLTRHG